MRDDFSKKTVKLLAENVGHKCSRPGCPRSTIGPAKGSRKAIITGKAAHITAASPGGPRYDPGLTREQRSHYDNGIWLCGPHADVIDRDEEHFTVEELRRWKEEAEDRQFREIDEGYQNPDLDLEEADIDARRQLGLPDTDNITALLPRLLSAAKRDLDTFKRESNWPTVAVHLTLRDSKSNLPATEPMLVAALERSEVLALVAAPGTGKSTSMGQIAEHLHSRGQTLPVLVKLSDWSLQTDNLLRFICGKPSWRAFADKHLMLAGFHGKLTLLLDGWNEVDPEARRKLVLELESLKREFPLLSIAISTRRQAVDLPLSPRVIEIESLTEEQQLHIARALRGGDGEALLEQAWRTPGIRDLIVTPLYLTALLSGTPGTALPETKEEVLRLFADKHENDPENAEIYRSRLLGRQRTYLCAIATSTTAASNVSILEEQTREIVKAASKQIEAQTFSPPEPVLVVDTLVNRHALVRPAGNLPAIQFQHQQIQEWYASFDVEKTILAVTSDADAKLRLRRDILNMPPWEEPIFFACERLSREGADQQASVAETILAALGIDPMLAAEMIFRSTSAVWERVKEPIRNFVARWHTIGRVDRALRFMLVTGRSDFANEIWPIISNPDTQVALRALRIADPLRPGALADIHTRLRGLATEQRQIVARELIHNGNASAIDAVGVYGETETDTDVLSVIIESLLFRRADRWAQKLLATAPDPVWANLAKKGFDRELACTPAAERLNREVVRLAKETNDPVELLARSLDSADPVADDVIADAISKIDFKQEKRNAVHILHELHKKSPVAVASALADRLRAGMDIPYGCADLLNDAPLADDDALTVELLDTTSRRESDLARIAGPHVIEAMIDEAYVRHQRIRGSATEAQRNAYHVLGDRLTKTRPNPFAEAMLMAGDTDDVDKISVFAGILAQHSVDHSSKPLPEIGTPALTDLMRVWCKTVLANPATTRYQMAQVAQAVGRLGNPILLDDLLILLDAELIRLAEEAEQAKRDIAAGRPRYGRSLHDTQYREALIRTGGPGLIKAMEDRLSHPHFGPQAAIVLKQIWRQETDDNAPRRFGQTWPDYSKVKANRQARASKSIAAHPIGVAILNAAAALAKQPEADDQRRALEIARIGFTIPYRSQDALIRQLIGLPIPITSKQQLFLSLAEAGEILDAELMLEGLRAFLELAKKETWRLDDNHSDLPEWLELIAFSGNPLKLLEAMALVPALPPSSWRLHQFISSLPHVPGQAEELLLALADKYPALKDTGDWQEAVFDMGSSAELLNLLDKVLATTSSTQRRQVDTRQWAQAITEKARSDPQFRNDVVTRFKSATGSILPVLKLALIQLADEQIVMELVRHYALSGRPFDHELRQAIDNAATHRRPSVEWKGAFEILGTPAPMLRRQLFDMFLDDGPSTKLARDCLLHIDYLRDKYGRPDVEPRHPNIPSGVPWPPEAGGPKA